MTTPRRRPATGLPDSQVERIITWLIYLRGRLDIGDACSAILYARWARNRGERDWPRTLSDLADALPPSSKLERRLWAVPQLATTICPSGAA